MLLHIDAHSGVPIYRQIMDQVRREILSGSAAPGRQLPAVRQLAGQLKVNPMTVSKAYAYLELEGLLERRRGVGLFVAQVEPSEKEATQREILSEQIKQVVLQAKAFGMEEVELLELVFQCLKKK